MPARLPRSQSACANSPHDVDRPAPKRSPAPKRADSLGPGEKNEVREGKRASSQSKLSRRLDPLHPLETSTPPETKPANLQSIAHDHQLRQLLNTRKSRHKLGRRHAASGHAVVTIINRIASPQVRIIETTIAPNVILAQPRRLGQ